MDNKEPFRPEGFVGTAPTWIEFYEECARRGIGDNDYQGRLDLLREFVKEKRALYMPHPEEYFKAKLEQRTKKDNQ